MELVVESPGPLLAGSDSRRELVWHLDRDGRFHFPESDLAEIAVSEESEGPLVAADHEIHGLVAAADAEGLAVVGRLRFTDSWTRAFLTGPRRYPARSTSTRVARSIGAGCHCEIQ